MLVKALICVLLFLTIHDQNLVSSIMCVFVVCVLINVFIVYYIKYSIDILLLLTFGRFDEHL